MKFVADLHIHSRFSRATSPQMDIESLSTHAEWKGITLLGTGDFTHPVWLDELKKALEPTGKGLFKFKNTHFILQGEVDLLFYRKGVAKNVHTILFVPSFEVAESVNKKLWTLGNLLSDGRPILTIDAEKFVEEMLRISKDCLFVPAHAWTPHFSIFGSNSGFDSVEECFGSQAENIYALETGLSSDPAMNWRLSRLDRYTLISNSDSHSPLKIGREANVFDTELDYHKIIEVLKTKDAARFLYTIEFFPEEGKYHYDGHRKCGVVFEPRKTRESKGICPKCGRPLTVGVMNRVDSLADRPDGFVPKGAIPFKNMIPLLEIIADAKGVGVGTQAVERDYHTLIRHFGTELMVLFDVPEAELREYASEKIAAGILRVRGGKVRISPGYDGEYGKISIFEEGEKIGTAKQLELF